MQGHLQIKARSSKETINNWCKVWFWGVIVNRRWSLTVKGLRNRIELVTRPVLDGQRRRVGPWEPQGQSRICRRRGFRCRRCFLAHKRLSSASFSLRPHCPTNQSWSPRPSWTFWFLGDRVPWGSSGEPFWRNPGLCQKLSVVTDTILNCLCFVLSKMPSKSTSYVSFQKNTLSFFSQHPRNSIDQDIAIYSPSCRTTKLD